MRYDWLIGMTNKSLLTWILNAGSSVQDICLSVSWTSRRAGDYYATVDAYVHNSKEERSLCFQHLFVGKSVSVQGKGLGYCIIWIDEKRKIFGMCQIISHCEISILVSLCGTVSLPHIIKQIHDKRILFHGTCWCMKEASLKSRVSIQ